MLACVKAWLWAAGFKWWEADREDCTKNSCSGVTKDEKA